MKVHAVIITIVSSRNIVCCLLDAIHRYCQLYINIVLIAVTLSTTKKGGCFLLLSMSKVPYGSKDGEYEFHYNCDARCVVIGSGCVL